MKIPFGTTPTDDPLALDTSLFKLVDAGEPNAEHNTEEAVDGEGRFMQSDATMRRIKHTLKYQVLDTAALELDTVTNRTLPTAASGAPNKENAVHTVGVDPAPIYKYMINKVAVNKAKHWTLVVECELIQDVAANDQTVTHVDLGLRAG